jgi:hypothetical protein
MPTGGPAAGGTAVEAGLTSVSVSANIALQFHFSTGAAPVSSRMQDQRAERSGCQLRLHLTAVKCIVR